MGPKPCARWWRAPRATTCFSVGNAARFRLHGRLSTRGACCAPPAPSHALHTGENQTGTDGDTKWGQNGDTSRPAARSRGASSPASERGPRLPLGRARVGSPVRPRAAPARRVGRDDAREKLSRSVAVRQRRKRYMPSSKGDCAFQLRSNRIGVGRAASGGGRKGVAATQSVGSGARVVCAVIRRARNCHQ